MTVVRTRFAPSPTGYMHIGGMRTALFNWLWARHNGGQFILRIDDTDQQRNVEEALEPIFNAFRWLELDWDEGPQAGGDFGPYYQLQRTELYQQAADRLLAEGKAYRDYDTPEQIAADRTVAEKEKRQYVNIRRSLELSDADRQQYEDEGRPSVVRFLVPRDQKVAIDDAVRGHVEWDAALISDPVIQRTDGSALYNFATTVDDGLMQISHVIRAEEHLSNTPVQVMIHEALGNTLPVFAHIPFVSAPGSKEKLSKREKSIEKYRKNPQFKAMFDAADAVFPLIGLGSSQTLNPVMVEYYEKIGYLPEAVLNALARLGWSLDDKTEILSRATIVENFTLDRVVKSSAGLDPDKLASYQAHWMGEQLIEQKIGSCANYLVAAGWIDELTPALELKLRQVILTIDDRLKLKSDILNFPEFFLPAEKIEYDEKAFKKRIAKEGAAELLRKFQIQLTAADAFDAASLDKLLHDFVDAQGISIGEIIHALRVATTGRPAGAGMFETLELIGQEECDKRITRTLAMLEQQ